MTSTEEWWSRLTPEARKRFAEDPFGPVPSDLLGEAARAGRSPVGSFWPETQSGPDGTYLASDVQQWIHDHCGDQA